MCQCMARIGWKRDSNAYFKYEIKSLIVTIEMALFGNDVFSMKHVELTLFVQYYFWRNVYF